ncbi:hypothetical protein [Jejuia pallidilutea]|nr:hypothetical protein [Jejuia pallidilutea]
MKHLLLLLCIGCVAILSCDGRMSKKEALKESIETFRNAKHAVKTNKIFPETYAEVENDTILSNGYRVKIKNFTNMNKFIDHTTSNLFDETLKFRRIDSEITVYKNDKLIYRNIINNAFSEYHIGEKFNIQQYLNNGISVDEVASLKLNKVVLITSNIVPKSSYNSYYKIIIDEYGNSNFKEIEDART